VHPERLYCALGNRRPECLVFIRAPFDLVVLVLLPLVAGLSAPPAGAATRGTLPDPPWESLEISVQLGLAGGGTFSGGQEADGTPRGDFTLDSATALGAAFAWGSQGRRSLELSWMRRVSEAHEQSPPAGSEPASFRVTLDDWQLEGDAQWGPFAARHFLRVGPLLGLTRFVSNNVSRWRPTIGLGAGTRTSLAGPWIARINLRLRLTRIGEDPFLCESNGCIAFEDTGWIGRWELGLGLGLLL
jgi:hypothetical protein